MSIAQPATPFATRNPRAQHQAALTPPPTLVEQFYAEAKRQIVTGDYLRRKWVPLYGPRFYLLIKALRGHCDYDISEGEARCYPSETTLAEECRVSRRTIITWLARVKQGEEQKYPGLKVGDFCHHRHGKALQQFLRIKAKLRYDRHGQRSVKAVHDYFIRMDDPPVPEDVPLIWEKAHELAMQYLAAQAQEQERDARRREFETKAAQRAFSGPPDFTSNNVQNLHTQQCEKSAHNRLSLPASSYPDTDRTISERESAEMSIRNVNAAHSSKKALVLGKAASALEQQQTCSEVRREPRRPAGAPETNQTTKAAPTAFEQALRASEDEAGMLLVKVLRQYGDVDPVDGMGTILVALVEAGAPVERLRALIELGQHRLRRREERGGHIQRPQAYYIGTMQRLAQEAQEHGWDVAALEAQDQAKHTHILRQRAMRHHRYSIVPKAESAQEAQGAEAEAASDESRHESEVAALPAAGGYADADPSTSPEEGMGEEIDETWIDSLRSTITSSDGAERRVAIYWGFVEAELRKSQALSQARKNHLFGIQACAIDPAQPRELLLLCTASHTARFIELTLRAEIEAQRAKLLAREFDVIRAVTVPRLPNWAERQ
jgi:hypothetical protein